MSNIAPALVVGAGLNGLGVVRSLALGGIPTIVADTTRHHPAMWSRFSRTMVLDRLHDRSLVDGLLTAQKKLLGQPVLILTEESAVSTVSEHRDELLKAFKFHLPPHPIVMMLQNKARFREFADENELPAPRTVIVNKDTSFEELSALPLPVVVKPAARPLSETGTSENGFFATTFREAEKICARLLETNDELVVQEWIEGPESNICFSLFYLGHRPENFKIFTGRKLASNPPLVGNAALCLSSPELMDGLEPLIAKFLDLTDFEGLGSVEFKWDARDRRHVIIGHTVGRTDWQEEIATLSGINLPLAAYRDEVGLPPMPAAQIDRNVAWRESALFDKDIPMLSPATRIYEGYWRLNDPVPGLVHYSRIALEKMQRRARLPFSASGVAQHLQSAHETKLRDFLKTKL